MTTTHILARTATLDAIHAALSRYDLAENRPARSGAIPCAACGRPADVWNEGSPPLCAKCHLITIGAYGDDEVQV